MYFAVVTLTFQGQLHIGRYTSSNDFICSVESKRDIAQQIYAPPTMLYFAHLLTWGRTLTLRCNLDGCQIWPTIESLGPCPTPNPSTKFDPNRIKTVQVILVTDKHTDKQTDKRPRLQYTRLAIARV